MTVPTLRHERALLNDGKIVCGIDEVGRGAWAGPVTVAAVIPSSETIRGVRDSKQLTPEQRTVIAARVHKWAQGVGIGHASHDECDELGMTVALRNAADRALAQLHELGFDPDHILLDGHHDYLANGRRVETIIKGDSIRTAIAAASVVAKVKRDEMMVELAEHYPAYWFESNKGYPAPKHQAALAAYGPSAIHRRTWIYMERSPWGGLPPPPGRLL